MLLQILTAKLRLESPSVCKGLWPISKRYWRAGPRRQIVGMSTQFSTSKSADSEYEKVVEYQWKQHWPLWEEVHLWFRSFSRWCGHQLAKLELLRLDDSRMAWQRFWNQFKAAVCDWQAMLKAVKGNYLLTSPMSSTVSAIVGLQVSDDNCDHAI